VSTRQIRSVHHFARHQRDIEVTCYCRDKTVLPYSHVISKISAGLADRAQLRGSVLPLFEVGRCAGVSGAHGRLALQTEAGIRLMARLRDKA
jgi:hypothetical protein